MRDLISSSEAAAILNCKTDNVRRLAREGRLRPVIASRLGRLFARRDVEKFAEERRERARAAAAERSEPTTV
jgi:excisionase family DNA binding protein